VLVLTPFLSMHKNRLFKLLVSEILKQFVAFVTNRIAILVADQLNVQILIL